VKRPAFQRYLDLGRFTARIAWQASPSLVVGLGFATLALGVVPAAAALTARGLIDATVPQLTADDPSLSPVLPWLIAGMVIAIVEAVLQLLREYLNKRLRDDLNLAVTDRILAHAAELDVGYFENANSQDLLQRAQDRAGERFHAFVNGSFSIATTGVQVISLAAVLASIEPLTLIAIALLALPHLVFQSRLATNTFEIEEARATKRRWTSYFVHQLTVQPAVAEVKSLGLGPFLTEKFRNLMTEFRDEDKRLYLRALSGTSVFAMASTVVFYGLMVRVVMRAIGGAASLGDVAIYAGATARLRGAVQEGVNAFRRLKEASLHIATLRRFLAVEPPLRAGTGLRPETVRGEIDFEGLRFRYPGSMDWALDGVDLHIQAGETIALVGENGSGKTTLAKLVSRLYDPTEGRILLDGHELGDYDPEYLYEQIGFVFQQFARYEASVADNIGYGNWRALLSDRDRVKEIARLAGVDELVAAMPDGYDTQLGPRFGDHDLSGGQWQRIAVARAFARAASILILDEPTASLDVRAEHALFERFRALAKGRTTILISHRFSTVSMADRIAVMENGRIVECDTHDALIRLGGRYAELHGLHRGEGI